MEWQLTDEAIAGIEESTWPSGYVVAGVQAKKLVAWLDELNDLPRRTKLLGIVDGGHLFIKAEDWQELKRQVGLK